MIDFDIATTTVLSAASTIRTSLVDEAPSQVELWAATGHTLAENIHAPIDDPPFDRSAMDGYAYRSADVPSSGGRLTLVGEAPAGVHQSLEVGHGQAVAIMTGAQIPPGADTVVILEDTSRSNGEIFINTTPPRGSNIRYQGESIRSGSIAIPSGSIVDGLTVGVLASLGVVQPSVHRKPRVTVLGTGTELVDADTTPGPGQIRDSNRHVLMDLLRNNGAVVVDGGRVSDDHLEISRALRQGFESDITVISGGVSAGAYDLVTQALAAESVRILFHKVSMKPGKPVLVGVKENRLVFGLPGNPVSTYVTALLFLLPAVRILAGHEPGPWTVGGLLSQPLQATGNRTTFHPARMTQEGGARPSITPIPWLGSADQRSFSRANCLIHSPALSPALDVGAEVTAVLPSMPHL